MDTIYIPSRGRYKTMSTHKHFEAYGNHNWFYVVEKFEILKYINALKEQGVSDPESHVLAFDCDIYKEPYHAEKNPKGYQYLDDLGWKPGLTTGPGPARNALIDFARERGESHLWMMDDDITGFDLEAFYLRKKIYTKNSDGSINSRMNLVKSFELFERLLDKYENVGLAEFEKSGMAMNARQNKQLALGGKTYSCIRINTAIDIPWRSRWNDDVVYSLDYLKRGYVNVGSKMMSYITPDSQSQAGGMTSSFKELGTLDKVAYLVKAYPDAASLSIKFGRLHHEVNYSRYKKPLILKQGATLDDIIFDIEKAGLNIENVPLITETLKQQK